MLSKLESAQDELLDTDGSVKPGCVGGMKDAEKRIRHKLLPRNAWMLVPYFELFMSRASCTNGVHQDHGILLML